MKQQEYVQIRKQLHFGLSRLLVTRHFLFDAGLIACAIGLRHTNIPVVRTVAPSIILAFVYFRAFGLMHEAVHSTAHKNSRWNLIVGRVAGWMCFLPYEAWKKIHLEHHRWAGNFDQDPTMKIVQQMREDKVAHPKLFALAWRFGIPLAGFNQHLVFWARSLTLSTSTSQRWRFLLGAGLWLCLAATSIFIGFHGILALSLVIYLVLVETVNFPHHLDLPQLAGQDRLQTWDQHLIARTCLYPAFFARHFLLNFNYHVEHHLFPTLPYRELPEAHRMVRAIETLNVSLGNSWIRKSRTKIMKNVFIGPILRPTTGQGAAEPIDTSVTKAA